MGQLLSASEFTGLEDLPDFVRDVMDEVCGWQALMAWRDMLTSMSFFSVSWHTSIESIFVCRLGCCVRELLGGKDP